MRSFSVVVWFFLLLAPLLFSGLACQYQGGAPSPVPAASHDTNSTPAAGEDSGGSALAVSALTLSVSSPLILEEGEDEPLSVTVQLQGQYDYPRVTGYFKPLERTVLWFSNDASVVSVSKQGVLVATGVGQTFVMATLGTLTVPLQVMVREAPAPALVSLAFYQDTVRLSTQTPRFLPLDVVLSDGTRVRAHDLASLRLPLDCEPSFSSSNLATAWVNQRGDVTPIANGSTEIAVYCGSASASATVIVTGFGNETSPSQAPAQGAPPGTTSGPVPASGNLDETVEGLTLTMSDTGWTMGASKALSCELAFNTGTVGDVGIGFETPTGALGEVSWESSNEDLARIDRETGRVDLLGYGTVTLTASYTLAETRVVDEIEGEIKMASETPTDDNSYLGPDDAGEVVDYGRNGGYGDQLRPEVFWFGPWETNTDVVSLGAGGRVTFPLHGYLPVDGEGIDFKVYENVVPGYPERAQVSVSEDGETFFAFPCDAFDSDGDGAYQGCAGITPTADGGDGFDLADVGLSEARYIRITDMNTCTPGDPTFILYEGSILCRGEDTQGADIDAVEIVNGVNE